jgi:hypothetical protein
MKLMNLESNIKSHASDLAMVQRTTSSNIIQNKIPTPPTPTAFLDFFSQCPTSNDSVGRGREDGTSGSSGVPKEVFSSCCRAMSLRLLELFFVFHNCHKFSKSTPEHLATHPEKIAALSQTVCL